ncbi:hypothetical protein KSB_60030 [Ktedonobacter robiniae]|uniref:Uncharacterized protein n=1 Tax=Ktedonobacter robiniae TaxID=2778365 RepID=A0ABQ3UXY2_9CHLR|nr:hypothetical protein KSB_60030 [Ktedonobacter robiniae]
MPRPDHSVYAETWLSPVIWAYVIPVIPFGRMPVKRQKSSIIDATARTTNTIEPIRQAVRSIHRGKTRSQD